MPGRNERGLHNILKLVVAAQDHAIRREGYRMLEPERYGSQIRALTEALSTPEGYVSDSLFVFTDDLGAIQAYRRRSEEFADFTLACWVGPNDRIRIGKKTGVRNMEEVRTQGLEGVHMENFEDSFYAHSEVEGLIDRMQAELVEKLAKADGHDVHVVMINSDEERDLVTKYFTAAAQRFPDAMDTATFRLGFSTQESGIKDSLRKAGILVEGGMRDLPGVRNLLGDKIRLKQGFQLGSRGNKFNKYDLSFHTGQQQG